MNRPKLRKVPTRSSGECLCGCGFRRNPKRRFYPGHSQYRNPRIWQGDGPGEQPVAQPKMAQALANQYETLPAQYTTRGGLTITMNRKGLIEVANHDSFAFREIVRRFGADAVNDILAGRRA